jgi:hypothetical protein
MRKYNAISNSISYSIPRLSKERRSYLATNKIYQPACPHFLIPYSSFLISHFLFLIFYSSFYPSASPENASGNKRLASFIM